MYIFLNIYVYCLLNFAKIAKTIVPCFKLTNERLSERTTFKKNASN